jgi:hypothetical protein
VFFQMTASIRQRQMAREAERQAGNDIVGRESGGGGLGLMDDNLHGH